VCIGAAIWCAAGIVSVESSAPGAARVLAPAPWWVLIVGLMIGAGVPAWRRSPLTALPALCATLPWWPVPLPTVALLWTGPLAWLPILVALAAALRTGWLGRVGQRLHMHEPRRASALAALLTVALGSLTLWSLNPRLPGGDEPHYLIITQSLWLDGDLRIENNHTQRDYAEYFSGELRPDFINRGQDREIYSIHAPGVSALVLPGYAAFGLRGAQLTILFCLMVTAVLVWRTAWVATGDATAAWFVWAGVMGAATTLLLGVMVFPDSPAALGVAAGVWLLVALATQAAPVRVGHLVAVSSALAALPWLHTRFAILAAGLGLAILVAIWSDARLRARRVVAFLAVPVASAAAWFLSFWLIYGTVDPRAPYRGAESIREWIWGAVVGLFADQQFGLLVFTPVLVAAVIGVGRATSRPVRLVSIATMVLLVGYTLAVASYHMWWAGRPALPARFLTAALPLLAVPLGIAWARAATTGRTLLLALLGVSWLITAVVITHDHGLFAFNDRDGQAAWLEWLSPVVNLPRAWPSFFWRTEGAFLAHVAAWVGVWIAAWLLLRAMVRWDEKKAPDVFISSQVAIWVLASLMAAAEVGWRLNGVSGLDPARSQLAVHAAERTWRIGAGSGLSIRADEARLFGRPANELMTVGPVPAGEYDLVVQGNGSRDTTLSARIGRSRTSLMTWTVNAGAEQVLPLSLPAGAASLSIDAESAEAAAGLSVVLRPRGRALTSDAVARAFSTDGDAAVFFLDDAVFVEPSGFWVRGGREARVVWSAGVSAAGRTRPLRLRNGGAVQIVTVAVDGWSEAVTLDAWQELVVMLPAADATGTWRVGIRSPSGFRPSDASGGTDDRYLGVWIGF
jgi:hypothetical protein